ncbi:MAG: hypothetical protein FWE98_01730 [Oscillospiraceae bacterium]|nr:hypothetical protein [Oscillospiraceae bacterium]
MKSEAIGEEKTPKSEKRIARWRCATIVIGAMLPFLASVLATVIPGATDYKDLMVDFNVIAFLVCLVVWIVLRLNRSEERISKLEEALGAVAKRTSEAESIPEQETQNL